MMMIVRDVSNDAVLEESQKRGLEIFGLSELPENMKECEGQIGRIADILSKVPYPVGRVDAELVKGRFLSSVGLIYGLLIEKSLGWILCQIRSDDSEEDDFVDAVVNPDKSHFIYPIGIAYKEAHQHGGETLSIYEKIKNGNLPDVPPGSFHEIKP